MAAPNANDGAVAVSAAIPRIPIRTTTAEGAYITSVGLHPVEPLQVIGLSSGEVGLYTAGTDALAWILELDARRQARQRLDNAAAIPASPEKAERATPETKRKAATAAPTETTMPPPPYPVKVFAVSTETTAASAAVTHCGFLRGRAEDLVEEVVRRRVPNLAPVATVRHLLYVVTSANDVLVIDIHSEAVLVRWAGSNNAEATSPLHPSLAVTQVETYGALLFLTVARRAALTAANNVRAMSMGGLDGGPERNAVDGLNEPFVYVLHLGYTDPLQPTSGKGLFEKRGAYLIKAGPLSKKNKKKRLSSTGTSITKAAPASSSVSSTPAMSNSLSIRVHPFAPLLLLLLNRVEVQMYAFDAGEATMRPKKAQLVLVEGGSSSTGPSSGHPSSLAAASHALLDAQFVPSAVVLRRRAIARPSPSSSVTARCSCRNVQIALLSATRLRLVCTRAATSSSAATDREPGDAVVIVDRAFYAAPDNTLASGAVRFQRLWTWLASPDTVFLLRSDRTVLELSCNDLLAASMGVPVIRSSRMLPPRTVAGTNSQRSGGRTEAVMDWWRLPRNAASGLGCVHVPDVLPLWGCGAAQSGLFAPRLPAYHGDDPQTILFSRLAGLTQPLPIATAENGAGTAPPTLHLSLLVETETLSTRCIAIRLCLTPQQSLSTAAASKGVSEESINVQVARIIGPSAAPALCRLEHGFYFVGSRAESAYADYPFLIAALLYLEDTAESAEGPTAAVAGTRLQVAMICMPADKQALRHLYDTARRSGGASCAEGAGSQQLGTAPSAELKKAVRHAVQHTQVHPLPIPQFGFEVAQSANMTKQLLSCASQLSNDGVVPCVWGLWAPVSSPKSTEASIQQQQQIVRQPLQLTMQAYYVTADTHELRWRPPELVQMDDSIAANPSQVFVLSSVLTKGGSDPPLPTPYASVEEALQDVEAAVVDRLFLYYADRKVLLLATVETGSSREAGFEAEGIDDTYNFASRARNGRVMGGQLFTGNRNAGNPNGGDSGRQFLRLIPHAAAEMNEWKAEHSAEALSSSLLSAIQLSAVLVDDHGEPALHVAVVSRRFGVAMSVFPLAGRRGRARVSATLQPLKVHLYRRWDDLLCVTAAVNTQAEEGEHSSRRSSSPMRGPRHWQADGVQRETVLGMEDVQHSALLRRYRAWVDTVAFPSTAYASVPLLQWVWAPAWAHVTEAAEKGEVAGQDAIDVTATTTATREPAGAAAEPLLVLQRGRGIYLLHLSGSAVQMCTSLLHCSPIQFVPRTEGNGAVSASSPPVVCLQQGSYPGLMARTRLLRQVQLHYSSAASLYSDATAAAQSPSDRRTWFRKYLKSTQSPAAARKRAQARPQQMAWLQHVYAPGPAELSYTASDRSGGTANASGVSENAARDQVVGTGLTHVGNVWEVNTTEPLRAAALAVEALAASRGIQQLVSSAGMLTGQLRQTLRHITAVLQSSNHFDNGTHGGDNRWENKNGGSPLRVMRSSRAVAEALARVPLACVTEALSQEVRLAAEVCATSAATAPQQQQTALADLHRWWWLLLRSSALVTAVNGLQTEEANRAVEDVFTQLPLDSPLLPPVVGAKESEEAAMAATVAAVSQALILCAPRFMTEAVSRMLRKGTRSCGQRQRCLQRAVVAALAELGGEDATATSALRNGNGEQGGAAAIEVPWSVLFSTICMDDAHWTHAVYYANLLAHLRHLTEPSKDGEREEPDDDDGAGLRATAVACLAGADASVGASANAVLDVATQTVGLLLGAVVDVPATSRTRMATAVAQSASKRQQVLRSGEAGAATGGRPARGGNNSGEVQSRIDAPTAQADAYFYDAAPVDQLRHRLYAAQWRDVYDAFAYPTRYFFADAPASPPSAASLPCQLSYDASMANSRTRLPSVATAAADLAPSAVNCPRPGRVGEVRMSGTPPPDADAGRPVMELTAMPSSAKTPHQGRSARPSTTRSPVLPGAAAPPSSSSGQPPQRLQTSPLSLRAALAKEEADLHRTYFNAFAPQEMEEVGKTPSGAPAAPASGRRGGGEEDRDTNLARQFVEELRAVGGPDELPTESTVRRERQKAEERQRVPGPAAFGPSVSRRATNGSGGSGGAAGQGAYGEDLYGAVPSQQTFFARFSGQEEEEK